LGEWRIELTSSAEKSLKRLSRADQSRVREAIDGLPAGGIKKLRGRSNQFRLRVGEIRVIFLPEWATHRIIVVEVFPRGAGY
jgi:mRNA-degrading endonuclease RelE of RelBE toxin-antitoxin system